MSFAPMLEQTPARQGPHPERDELIRKLSTEMTVLVIEHDMEMVMGLSDTITVLHQGTVLATGTPAEIRDNPRVQEAYLGGHSEAELAH